MEEVISVDAKAAVPKSTKIRNSAHKSKKKVRKKCKESPNTKIVSGTGMEGKLQSLNKQSVQHNPDVMFNGSLSNNIPGILGNEMENQDKELLHGIFINPNTSELSTLSSQLCNNFSQENGEGGVRVQEIHFRNLRKADGDVQSINEQIVPDVTDISREHINASSKEDHSEQKLQTTSIPTEKTVKYRIKLSPCTVCKKVFTRPSTLNVHFRLHSGVTPHKCTICGQGFVYKRELVRHQQTHTGVYAYTCDICESGFNTRYNLNIHKLTHKEVKPFACEFCSKTFVQNGDLKSHLRIHTGERPFTCEECGRCFAYKSGLTTHLRIHSGERPYKCQFCNKGCIHKGDLNTHMRVHTGERPYSCEVCNKTFVQNTDLKRHLITHGGVRPFECPYCPKRFVHRGTMNNHIRTHTGERPFLCAICGKQFTEHGSLKIHKRNVHKISKTSV